ncbi:hypothetical protein CUMW_217040 [Citrus unshiu]|uniref:Uncharacterized protein n=1 Tax=Citrus unshiu TaxID=55188 RepID=A0A2H5QCN7_CITUN|nr:hypothetical protein CUMW_217040 [Citrus unshiu]
MEYMAPEQQARLAKESGVYSYATVALKIACGRKPINPMAKKEGRVYGIGKLVTAADPRLWKL